MNLTIKRAVVTAVAAISVLAGSATVASAASPHGGPKHHCKHGISTQHGKFTQHGISTQHGKFTQHGNSTRHGKFTKIRHDGRHHHTMHLKGHRLPIKILVTKRLANRSH
ncbi:hypothetical protein [Streptomyces sp. NBC_01602]|uniref:hypothetical protein n=1 Tax=Streptomyces sp. NBC_01602 TaxID=2975893 RepID=UPI0038660999